LNQPDTAKLGMVLVAELMEDDAVARLAEDCEVDVKYRLSREELLEIIPAYDAIIVRSETIIDKQFLDAAVNCTQIAEIET